MHLQVFYDIINDVMWKVLIASTAVHVVAHEPRTRKEEKRTTLSARAARARTRTLPNSKSGGPARGGGAVASAT